MSIVFHHFFVFTEKNAPVVDYLVSKGFAEGSRNAHPGQGTSNRRIFLGNGMLEFIWIDDPDEATSSMTARTRLFERSRSSETGYSPYGVCVCSAAPESGLYPFDGWSYRPNYLPKEIEIWNANNERQPWEPMIFYLAGVPPISSAISSREPISHPNGSISIKKIFIPLAKLDDQESDAMKKLRECDLLRFENDSQATAVIEIDTSGSEEKIDLSAWCPLRISLG